MTHHNKLPAWLPSQAIISGLILWFHSTTLGADNGGVFRWVDEQGIVQYADRPAHPSAELLQLQTAPGLPNTTSKTVRVIKVFDGDTLELEDGNKVRLLGINTPELPRRGKPGQAGGEAAHQALSNMILHSQGQVFIRFDRERKDHFGRVLAYLYDQDGLFMNAELLRLGHAHTNFKIPRLTREMLLLDAEREAIRHKRGIWRLDQFQVTTPDRLKDAGNQYRLVKGQVLKDTKTSKGKRRLELAKGFYILVKKDVSLPLHRYTGLNILVRGWIRSNKGTPWIKLEHASQIQGHLY